MVPPHFEHVGSAFMKKLPECLGDRAAAERPRMSCRRALQALVAIKRSMARAGQLHPTGSGWSQPGRRTARARLIRGRPQSRQPRRPGTAGSLVYDGRDTRLWGVAHCHDHRDHWLRVRPVSATRLPPAYRPSPNAKAKLPGPLQGLHAAQNSNAAPVKLSDWFGFASGFSMPSSILRGGEVS